MNIRSFELFLQKLQLMVLNSRAQNPYQPMAEDVVERIASILHYLRSAEVGEDSATQARLTQLAYSIGNALGEGSQSDMNLGSVERTLDQVQSVLRAS